MQCIMIRLSFVGTGARPVVLGSLSPKLRAETWTMPELLGVSKDTLAWNCAVTLTPVPILLADKSEKPSMGSQYIVQKYMRWHSYEPG